MRCDICLFKVQIVLLINFGGKKAREGEILPLLAAMCETQPRQRQEPGGSLKSPVWVQVDNYLGYLTLFSAVYQEPGLKEQHPGLECAFIQDAGTTGSGLSS